MESNNLIELIVAYYKDKTQQEILERFRIETCRLLQADADARRLKARELIMSMARLKIELTKFKYSYNKIAQTCGKMDAIDDYILDIEKRIKQLSNAKNHIQ